MRRYTGVQEKVADLWSRPASTIIVHGPFQSGKTAAALDGFLMYALMRGGSYLLSAPTLDQINNVLVRQITENHPSVQRQGAPGGYLHLDGGADAGGVTFRIHAGKGPNAEGALRGRQMQGAFIDECTLVDQKYFMQARARLSEGQGGKLVGCTNPDAPGHWLKKNVIDEADGVDVEAWSFSIDDNPSLTDKYKRDLHRDLRGVFRQRGYYGEWVAAEGAIYPTVSECEGRPPDGSEARAVWISADYGNTDPTHALRIEEHEDGVRYVVDEWRWSHEDGGHLTDTEKAQAIRARLGKGVVTACHLAPEASNFIAEMATVMRPVPCAPAASSVLPGIQQVTALLEHGLLKIDAQACPALFAEMARYHWKLGAASQVSTVPDHEASHGPDALRYHALSTAMDTRELEFVDERASVLG